MAALAFIHLLLFLTLLFIWAYVVGERFSVVARGPFLALVGCGGLYILAELILWLPTNVTVHYRAMKINGICWVMLGSMYLLFVLRFVRYSRIWPLVIAAIGSSTVAAVIMAVSDSIYLDPRLMPWGKMEFLRHDGWFVLLSLPGIAAVLVANVFLCQALRHQKQTQRSVTRRVIWSCIATSTGVIILDTAVWGWLYQDIPVRLAPHWFVGGLVLTLGSLRRHRLLNVNLQQFAETFFDDVNDAVLIADDNQTIQFANRNCIGVFHCDISTLLGAPLESVVPSLCKNDPYAYVPVGERVLKVNHYTSSLPSIAHLTIYVVRDVSEKRTAQMYLRKRRDDLETEAHHRSLTIRQAQKMEALATLSGGIAHDFNNLLTSIMGYATLAKEALTNTDPLRADLDEILAASTRAGSIVGQLVHFAGTPPFSATPINLLHLTTEVKKMLVTSIPENVTVVIDGKSAWVRGEIGRLHQAVINLITNAVAAMNGAGRVTMTTECVTVSAASQCLNRTLSPGRYVVLSVADTGCGIDESTLDQIFEPFFTTRMRGQGTGIGLATVFKVVEDHEGGIQVASTPGHGTTFRLFFPCASPSSQPIDHPVSTCLNLAGHRVLLVDDTPDVATVMSRMLDSLGMCVSTFCDGRSALTAFGEAPTVWHLALVDYRLPDMDGIQVAKQIKTICPHLPIVLISGHFGDSTITDAQTAGIDRCLSKPMKKRELQDTITAVMTGDGGQR